MCCELENLTGTYFVLGEVQAARVGRHCDITEKSSESKGAGSGRVEISTEGIRGKDTSANRSDCWKHGKFITILY